MISTEKKILFQKRLDILLVVVGLLSMLSILALVGFRLDDASVDHFKDGILFLSLVFIGQEVYRWVLFPEIKTLKTRWLENLMAVLLLFNIIYPVSLLSLLADIFSGVAQSEITLIDLIIIQVPIILVVIIRSLRNQIVFSRLQLHPGIIFTISFALVILIGTMLLMLPRATPEGYHISIADAVFTATSAVCVTGLIVMDTAKDFTLFGQIIILILIQIGALGIMTITTFFTMIVSGGLSFKVKILMREMLSEENISTVKTLLLKILLFTFAVELAGFLLLYYSTGHTFSNIDYNYLYSSLFHSVSAFCNAGFSIYSSGLMDSAVNNNYIFLSVIMALIVIGGIGFGVLSNFTSALRSGKSLFRYRITLTTKVVVITTLILIVIGAIVLWIIEPFQSNSEMTIFDKLFHSLFLSVTARTAGFNTVATELLSYPTVLVMILLMWIGASPGSCGGGVKTTTFALAFISLYNTIRGKERIEVFRRYVPNDLVKKALAIIFASLFALFIGSVLLLILEPDKKPIDLVFELTSAMSTVGLSRDITFHIGDGAKVLITVFMFIGRIGILTFLMAIARTVSEARYKLPAESIMIG
jgi:trk system potassium uptake protein TrkH